MLVRVKAVRRDEALMLAWSRVHFVNPHKQEICLSTVTSRSIVSSWEQKTSPALPVNMTPVESSKTLAAICFKLRSCFDCDIYSIQNNLIFAFASFAFGPGENRLPQNNLEHSDGGSFVRLRSWRFLAW